MTRRMGEGVDPMDPSGDKATLDRIFGQGDTRPAGKAASDGSDEIPFDVNPRVDQSRVAEADGRSPSGSGGRTPTQEGAQGVIPGAERTAQQALDKHAGGLPMRYHFNTMAVSFPPMA